MVKHGDKNAPMIHIRSKMKPNAPSVVQPTPQQSWTTLKSITNPPARKNHIFTCLGYKNQSIASAMGFNEGLKSKLVLQKFTWGGCVTHVGVDIRKKKKRQHSEVELSLMPESMFTDYI